MVSADSLVGSAVWLIVVVIDDSSLIYYLFVLFDSVKWTSLPSLVIGRKDHTWKKGFSWLLGGYNNDRLIAVAVD